MLIWMIYLFKATTVKYETDFSTFYTSFPYGNAFGCELK